MTESAKKATTPKKPRITASKTVAPTGIAAKTAAAPKKKTVKAKVLPMAVPQEQIAILAYRFWDERGRQHGFDKQDWLRAEQELVGKAS
jgi:ribosome assembly protein YihI (activator of Der GTPase)